jgi:hypothetical protein
VGGRSAKDCLIKRIKGKDPIDLVQCAVRVCCGYLGPVAFARSHDGRSELVRIWKYP